MLVGFGLVLKLLLIGSRDHRDSFKLNEALDNCQQKEKGRRPQISRFVPRPFIFTGTTGIGLGVRGGSSSPP